MGNDPSQDRAGGDRNPMHRAVRPVIRGRTPTGRRRLGILLPDLAGGGAERVTLAIAGGLIRRGHEVDLVLERLVCDYPEEVPPESRIFYLRRPEDDEYSHTSREPLPAVSEPLFQGPYPFRIRYPRLSFAPKLSWNQLPMLKSTSLPRWAAATAAYLDRERPDALLAMLIPSVAAATMAARVAHRRVRLVGALHNTVKWRGLGRARRSFPRVDAAVGVSRGVSAELKEAVGVPADRIHTVYNPVVSAGLVRAADRPAGHPWLDQPGPRVVLGAGRLNKQKDFSTLLAAFAMLVAHRPARLIVLGKGRLRARLMAEARELRIAEHVDFPGFVQNPYAFMAKASLFVLSSRHEGLPTVLIEAMACGCPVVSTDCPFGPDEILEDGRWGELVPVGDPASLGKAMKRALDMLPLPDALRKRAAFFSLERAVGRYEELLLG